MSEIVFADSEGDDLLPGLTKLWMIQLAVGEDGEPEVYADQPGFKPIKEAAEILKNAEKVVFHNGLGFDIFAINRFYPGTLRWQQVIDTMIISRFYNPSAKRHSLSELGELMGFRKGKHEDFSQFSQEMVVYGLQDVRILQKLWKGVPKKKVPSFRKLYEKYTEALELEFQTAYIISKQMQHGFKFNYEKAQLLEVDLRQEHKEYERELQKIFPPITTERWSDKTGKRLKDHVEVFNPGSNQQVEKRLKEKYGWKPDYTTPSGQAKLDEEILESLPYPEAKMIAAYKKTAKKLGQLADGKNAWLKMAVQYPNGEYYLHGYVNTLGCRTTRMSHSKPNVAQADGDPRMRALFEPDEGHVLVGVDAEGLELRMLAHYLFPYDEGKYSEFVHKGDKKAGTDVHTMNMKAAGLFLRDSAKTMIYAHNYGCFNKKLGVIVKDDAREAGQPIPEKSFSKLGEELRAKIESGIGGLGQLIDKCQKSHKKKEALPGINGCWIRSASDHSALNTLLQGNGSIVMKKALCLFEDEVERLELSDKIGYCANVHDEFQISVEAKYAEQIGEIGKDAITRAGIELGIRCPLVGEAKYGASWAETH